MIKPRAVEKVMNILTEQNIFDTTRDIIEDGLSDKYPDSTNFLSHLTVGQFKQLHGFQGSTKFLQFVANMFTARLCRAVCFQNPSIIKWVPQIFIDTIPIEERVGLRLRDYFTKKHGKVDESRIKELDEMVRAWYIQDGIQLEKVLRTGKFDDEKGS